MGNGKLFLILLVLLALYFLTRPGSKGTGTGASSGKATDTALPHIPVESTAESKVLANWLLEKATQQTGVDLSGDLIASKRIGEAAAGVLPMVREHGEMEVNLPFIAANAEGTKDFKIVVSRDTLHSIGLQ